MSASDPIVLVFDWLPPLQSDQAANAYSRARRRKRIRLETAWEWRARVSPDRRREWMEQPGKPHIVFTRHSSREPDSDNLAYSFKSMRDGLIDAGAIEDDSPSHITTDYRWKKAKPGGGHVTIDLTKETTS